MQVKLKTFTLEDLVQVPLLKYLAEGTPGRISIICTNLISITPRTPSSTLNQTQTEVVSTAPRAISRIENIIYKIYFYEDKKDV